MATKLCFDGGTINVSDTSRVENIFDRLVYHKGGWVLLMLRHVMGDSAFFKSLKTYMTGPLRYTSVRTADFKAVCEQVSGLNLDTFFLQWLNVPFYPRYTYDWSIDRKTQTAAGKVAVLVHIEQIQDQTIYDMPIDLTFSFNGRPDTTLTVHNNQRTQSYKLLLNSPPIGVVFDRDAWILKEVQQNANGVFHPDVTIDTPFPNPVSENTTIYVSSWDLQEVALIIYDINGRLVRRLSPLNIFNGHDYIFQWDRRNAFGRRVAAGIYFIRALRGALLSTSTRRVIVLN